MTLMPAGESSLLPNRQQELREELARRIAACVGLEQKRITEVPGLTVHRRTAPTPPCSMTYEPSLILTAQGRKRVEIGGKAFTYGSSHYLLASVALPVVARVIEASEQTPCLALSLKLQMPVVRELLSRDEFVVAPQAGKGPAIAIGELTVELLDSFCRLMRLLDQPREIDFLHGLIEREIIFRVLQGPEGARLRTIATLGDQSYRTAKAIAWIKDNYAKPLRVEELAEIAGMGVSTLHHHFRALTAMSPLQYQKQIRLQEARTRMSIEGLDVGSAALEVGYESASQFTREYKRLFGQTPMRDTRAVRSNDPAQLEPLGVR
ncbi:AraC family transcriptional regulator [uncultured Paludibaculum sp.]|uniref:AraC family transcriptional regulator n=1 Tax=uncultured Paludibaculum sp. TaxID=1765020 RepID=UPI002AAB32D6|nr:AraC family transcriptional regulator [uncultured Paludibaculum sp.]